MTIRHASIVFWRAAINRNQSAFIARSRPTPIVTSFVRRICFDHHPDAHTLPSFCLWLLRHRIRRWMRSDGTKQRGTALSKFLRFFRFIRNIGFCLLFANRGLTYAAETVEGRISFGPPPSLLPPTSRWIDALYRGRKSVQRPREIIYRRPLGLDTLSIRSP